MKNRKIKLLPAVILSLSLCSQAVLPAFAEDSAQEAVYEKGVSAETGFQSEWLNLQFTPPAYMVMNSEEELQNIMQSGQNMVQQSGLTDENTVLPETVYEMMASSASGFPNVSLVVETSPQNSTVDQYFTALKQLLDAAQLGYQYEETVSDAVIAEQDFRVLTASLTMNGYQVFQKYCTRKQGDRFVSVILSYTEDTAAQADEILASFTVLHTPEIPEESTDNPENDAAQ